MKQNITDWLKLHISVTPGVKSCALVNSFGSASALFALPPEELLKSPYADERTVKALRGADAGRAEEIARICEKNGWDIITPDSALYPDSLRKIKDHPFVLFCSGDTGLLIKEPKISVVGTRSPSEKALMASFLLGGCLSSLDIVTVSGGAVGIDSAAHEGALTGNGGTIAVLGTGLGSDYLPENSFMRRRIEKNGLLLSEFSPFSPPSRYTFPKRNRIISALSDVTVVAESGESGGSLITADYAFKQGKKVFCFCNDIVSSAGCAALINKGALEFSEPGQLIGFCRTEPVPEKKDPYYLNYRLDNDGITEINIIKPSGMTADSFAAYNGITPAEAQRVVGGKLKHIPRGDPGAVPVKRTRRGAEKKSGAEKNVGSVPLPVPAAETAPPRESVVPEYITEDAKKVLAVLDGTPKYFDEILYMTSLAPHIVMASVTELELEGLACLHEGNRVSKT